MKVITIPLPTELGDGAILIVNGELVVALSDELNEQERAAIISQIDEETELMAA